jgi:hypothetical protein
MKHLFVPYEIALILKEKSFDENCFAWYHCPTTYENEELNKYTLKIDRPPLNLFKNGGGTLLIAPLYQQVIDWFREKHKLNIVFTQSKHNGCWLYTIEGLDGTIIDDGKNYHDLYRSYPIARIKAIEETLKLI